MPDLPRKLPAGTVVYRRIAAANSWVNENGEVHPSAFLPNKGDKSGLSLSLLDSGEKVAATGAKGKKFYAAPILVDHIESLGLRVVEDRPGHAIIEGWTHERRDDPIVRKLVNVLAQRCQAAEGPFEGLTEPTPKKE